MISTLTVRWLAPVAVAGLVMFPRLASPQFGLLDDGLTLQTSREVIGRWSSTLHLIPETGRFFPAYWLVYSAVFGLVGARPLEAVRGQPVVLDGRGADAEPDKGLVAAPSRLAQADDVGGGEARVQSDQLVVRDEPV